MFSTYQNVINNSFQHVKTRKNAIFCRVSNIFNNQTVENYYSTKVFNINPVENVENLL